MTEAAHIRWQRPERNAKHAEGVLTLAEAAEGLFTDYGSQTCTDCGEPTYRTASSVCVNCDHERYLQEQRTRAISNF